MKTTYLQYDFQNKTKKKMLTQVTNDMQNSNRNLKTKIMKLLTIQIVCVFVKTENE